MSTSPLERYLSRLPVEQQRAIRRKAKQMNRERERHCGKAPSVLGLLTQERMQSPMSGYFHDQPENDIRLAWYLWSLREEQALFTRFCRTTPTHQLVHVLFLLRKIVRHPEWKLANRYRPEDEHLQKHKDSLRRSPEFFSRRQGHDYSDDLLLNARRYAGLESSRQRMRNTRP